MKRTYFSVSNDPNEKSRQFPHSTEATQAIFAVGIIIVPLQRGLPRVFLLRAQFFPPEVYQHRDHCNL